MLWWKNLGRKERCGSCSTSVREGENSPRFISVDNQRGVFCETTRKKLKHETLGGRSHGQRQCMLLAVSSYSQRKKKLYILGKQHNSRFFFLVETVCNPLSQKQQLSSQFRAGWIPCSITAVHSPGFLVHHCGRVMSAPVLGWDEAQCPEDEGRVNRANQR